jgi:hypothetical protein
MACSCEQVCCDDPTAADVTLTWTGGFADAADPFPSFGGLWLVGAAVIAGDVETSSDFAFGNLAGVTPTADDVPSDWTQGRPPTVGPFSAAFVVLPFDTSLQPFELTAGVGGWQRQPYTLANGCTYTVLSYFPAPLPPSGDDPYTVWISTDNGATFTEVAVPAAPAQVDEFETTFVASCPSGACSPAVAIAECQLPLPVDIGGGEVTVELPMVTCDEPGTEGLPVVLVCDPPAGDQQMSVVTGAPVTDTTGVFNANTRQIVVSGVGPADGRVYVEMNSMQIDLAHDGFGTYLPLVLTAPAGFTFPAFTVGAVAGASDSTTATVMGLA